MIGGVIMKKNTLSILIAGMLLLTSCSLKLSWRGSDTKEAKMTPTLSVSSAPSPKIINTPTKAATPVPSVTQTIDWNEDSLQVFTTLDNTKHGWGYKPNSEHKTPEMPSSIVDLLNKYSGYYVGDTSSKVIYLTFDEGYENGYTGQILDILKANDVKAAFFVTRPYIKGNADLIKRMAQEGHTVGNHTSHHPSMPDKTGDSEAFKKEFTDVEELYKELTGQDIPRFFRPPMGEFSEKSLAMTQQLGYKSIFWSFAHKDWLVDAQPDVSTTHTRVMNGSHNGEIMLLHAVSKSNTEALDSIIKDLKAQGYRFASLEELPNR